MALSRADRYNQLQKQDVYYSDFATDFNINPFSGDLVLVSNADDVKQSIQNLVLTELYERLYQPQIGTDAIRNLFENFMALTAQNLSTSIQSCISFNEPRAVLQNVTVQPDEDNNTYSVFIIFTLVNDTSPITLVMILDRIR